jgi:predicted Rossmann-fold nucleotide-binding protein
MRRTIVGVMGGNRVAPQIVKDAERIGASIFTAGMIVLTGGSISDESDVKHAAMRGAHVEAGKIGQDARLIGILPGGTLRWDTRSKKTFFLSTGLHSAERDAINGVTPDVLIFLAGGSGTLCELAFALQATKPVLFWRAVQPLRARYQECVTGNSELEQFLAGALTASRKKLASVAGITDKTTVRSLMELLHGRLHQAIDFTGTIEQLIAEARSMASVSAPLSGFPGFRHIHGTKDTFEQIVTAISA